MIILTIITRVQNLFKKHIYNNYLKKKLKSNKKQNKQIKNCIMNKTQSNI